MNYSVYPIEAVWPELVRRPAVKVETIEPLAATVFAEVERRGDAACRDFTKKYDGVWVENLRVTDKEFADAEQHVPAALRQALALAADNIRAFHEAQREPVRVVETMPGVRCWRRSVPIQSVGLYVPGGTAPLFSTVLMLAIPAALAGCQRVVMCTPPDAAGSVHPAVLYAAQLAGVREVYKLGGMQAIAAMALGTASIPAVHKIFGPGNQYVTAAKQYAARFSTAVDLPAGPSELLVVADNTAVPAFVAADLLSQAEHGTDSHVVLVCWQPDVAERIVAEAQAQLHALPRRDIAAQTMQYSRVVVLHSPEEAAQFVNAYAPEHLSLAVDDTAFFLERVVNAGSVFIGSYTPEAVGDYASGTNHTLPTGGWAVSMSGVSLDSFIKKITYQHITAKGLRRIGSAVEIMANAEMLEAHRRAVAVRLAALAEEVGNG